jgi:DNA topoisomerase VI subunit B
VKQENLAHIFSILRNSLYSDKAGAIIREYSTNAYDAHVQAGIKETPIKINCPSRFSPLLSIRDYGFGLNEEQIFNVYASYGESTKRHTNDQVGMMGLGSKSAFSYTDSFTVISYNDGLKKSYLAYIDDSGIGKIMKVNEEPTDETGIEIQVPVKPLDCYQFENAIVEAVKIFQSDSSAE